MLQNGASGRNSGQTPTIRRRIARIVQERILTTVAEQIQAKITDLEVKYQAELAQLQSDLEKLAPSGWLARDIEEVRVWFQALKAHF
jgi:hypothetical protein